MKDSNPATDQTIVTVEVTQGNKKAIFSEDEEAPTGGIVNYAVAILFE